VPLIVKPNRFSLQFAGVEKVSNEDIIGLDVDILIPAAIENVITAKNAKRSKPKSGRIGQWTDYS
jgi:glutamate dehydrogenase/leucine dehydrogenase